MPGRVRNHELLSTVVRLRAEVRLYRRETERLRVENEILREAAEPLIHLAPARERFAFIHARRARFSVNVLCRVLVADRCNYHAWVRAQVGRVERDDADERFARLILEIHTAHPAYGAIRVTRELKHQGFEVGVRRVARLTRERGIEGITRRRRRNLTRMGKDAAAVPDLICRDFSAPMPGLKLIGDITCFRTGDGWVYLATVLDLCSRELVGYAIAPHMRANLAVDAIAAAHWTGLVAGNAIMHTDRGSQYHSRAYRKALVRLEIRPSTSRIGSCLDGAAAESFFATIKSEIGMDYWTDRASARRDIENWITEYNDRRLHSTLDYQTPAATRRTWQQRMKTAF
jgi:putative transposase